MLQGLHGQFFAALGGNQDHRHAAEMDAHGPHEFQAVLLRHVDIRHHDIGTGRLHLPQRVGPVFGVDHVKVRSLLE